MEFDTIGLWLRVFHYHTEYCNGKSQSCSTEEEAIGCRLARCWSDRDENMLAWWRRGDFCKRRDNSSQYNWVTSFVKPLLSLTIPAWCTNFQIDKHSRSDNNVVTYKKYRDVCKYHDISKFRHSCYGSQPGCRRPLGMSDANIGGVRLVCGK